MGNETGESTAVHRRGSTVFERITAESSGFTFAVEEDHVIAYAGARFSEARNVIRGGNRVSVWRDGKWWGDVNFKGVWLFTTRHYRMAFEGVTEQDIADTAPDFSINCP